MVMIATALGRTGLQDWLLQRVSAVILGLYTAFMIAFWFLHGHIYFEVWHALFAMPVFKTLSLATLIALIVHAWIGMWTVTTDYIKPLMLRLTVQLFVDFGLIIYLVWGIRIFWSS